MNDEKSKELQAAEYLVLGFVKCWSMVMLEICIFDKTGMWPKEFQFLPNSRHWKGKAQVRAFVAQNYPKLNLFLTTATPQQQVAAAKQIVKLKWSGERPLGSLTTKERSELEKTRKELRGATTAYRESRKNFKNHSLHNWNVCK